MIKKIQYCLFKNKCRLVVKDKNGGLINISKTKICEHLHEGEETIVDYYLSRIINQ